MMRRLSLFAQITIIFIAAFIITSLLLGVFITRGLDNIFENTVYERLEAEGKSIRLAGVRDTYEIVDGIAYIRYSKVNNTYIKSDNMMPYINNEMIRLLLGKATTQTKYQGRYSNDIADNQVYYIILNYQGVLGFSDDIFIVITDSTIKNNLVKATRRRIYFVSLIAFSFGYIIILLWIIKFIDDTKKISFSLKKMGENHYKNSISTKRKDEVGDLARDIESMRKRLIDNELLKQEVVQKISHDLKTPIALISSYVEAYEDGVCDVDELAAIAKKETARLHTKVTKLLNLTRLGYIDTDVATAGATHMQSLIEDVVKLYSYQDKIDISMDLADASFLGDEESWRIVAQNILDNAMRYAKSKVDVKLVDSKLIILNDGVKIDDKLLPNIFSAYEKGKDGSSGLGLYIVKKTIEVFGYEIDAENIDSGVCFVIKKKSI